MVVLQNISMPERNVFKIPDDLDWDIAAGLNVKKDNDSHK
jgi:hypothetical protein